MKPDLMKLLQEAAEQKAIHVAVVELDESEPKEDSDPYAGAKEAAEEIAILNQIMYQAHINAGFTKEEALALTVATIEC